MDDEWKIRITIYRNFISPFITNVQINQHKATGEISADLSDRNRFFVFIFSLFDLFPADRLRSCFLREISNA